MLKKELNLGLLRIYLFLMKRSLNRFVYRLNLTTKKRTSLANTGPLKIIMFLIQANKWNLSLNL